MTALALDRRASHPLPVPLVLGLQEGRRIVLHPLALVGLVLTVLPIVVIGDNGPRDAFEVFLVGPGSYYGVLYFAAWSVASRDRRTHAGEVLAATPVPASTRVAALCVAALAPAALCAALVLSTHAVQTARGLYVVAPEAGHLAQPVATVLGGALLGVMVARLARLPGSAVLVMITMVAVDVWLSSVENGALLSTFMTWTVYSEGPEWTRPDRRAGTRPTCSRCARWPRRGPSCARRHTGCACSWSATVAVVPPPACRPVSGRSRDVPGCEDIGDGGAGRDEVGKLAYCEQTRTGRDQVEPGDLHHQLRPALALRVVGDARVQHTAVVPPDRDHLRVPDRDPSDVLDRHRLIVVRQQVRRSATTDLNVAYKQDTNVSIVRSQVAKMTWKRVKVARPVMFVALIGCA